ncbi:MAG: hypothetical protein FWC00_01465 [Firmicutes bacterium]|nr:hypothetical protein [Bacillota bacterium]
MNNYENINRRWQQVYDFLLTFNDDVMDSRADLIDCELEDLCEMLDKLSKHTKEPKNISIPPYPAEQKQLRFYTDFHANCMKTLLTSAEDVKEKLNELILQGEKAIADREKPECPSVSNAFLLPRTLTHAYKSLNEFTKHFAMFKHGIDTREHDYRYHAQDQHPIYKSEMQKFKKLGFKLDVTANTTFHGKFDWDKEQESHTMEIRLSHDTEPYKDTVDINTFNDFVPETLEKLYMKTKLETQEKMKDELFV